MFSTIFNSEGFNINYCFYQLIDLSCFSATIFVLCYDTNSKRYEAQSNVRKRGSDAIRARPGYP